MSLYVSTAWSEVEDNNLENIIETYVKNGINNIELSGGVNYEENVINILIKLKEKYGLNYIIHNYFPPPKEDFILNIASEDRTNRNRSIKFIKDTIDLGEKIDAFQYTFHAGYAKKMKLTDEKYFKPTKGKIDWKQTYKYFYESIDILKDYSKNKIKLGIENLFPYDEKENYSIMCTLEEIEEYLLKYKDDENIGLLIDLGHLNVAGHYMDFNPETVSKYLLENYKDSIFEFHISQNNGTEDSHDPISIDSCQLSLIKKYDIKNIPIVLEGKNLTFDLVKRINKII